MRGPAYPVAAQSKGALLPAFNAAALPGLGVKATVGTAEIYLGNLRMVGQPGADLVALATAAELNEGLGRTVPWLVRREDERSVLAIRFWQAAR
ncbi:hypothetical protein E4L96_19840 [Massilia arenosa]|uniref:Uncharacterized protein n=1 Tax=Zemynaea arenosa TaxID=2561931 RepID=A0A4Y9RYP2_9BURK|nr:hypothetical protein [Massilia arenosa]TFW13351.1 hypothetical protein E4L96_19840 [Massilia arenosa]